MTTSHTRRAPAWRTCFAGAILFCYTADAPAQQRWSDPATWGGSVPAAGQVVTIPAGRDVLLDVSPPPLGGLRINGTLRFAAADNLELRTGYILVFGTGSELRIGSESRPHRQRATITLTGTNEATIIDGVFPLEVPSKSIAMRSGGRLHLHGASRSKVSWTTLDAHAPAGSSTLTLAEDPGWEPGDQVVIAPSGYDPAEAEFRRIIAVDGAVVTLDAPLSWARWGTLQTYDGRTVDQRAEVGLLTRNIVVRGDDASEASQFGGCVLVLPGGAARIEGVEMYWMGQQGYAGRYGMGWRQVDRLAGGVLRTAQWIRDSSIHRSFHRAVNIQGTGGVKVHRVVAFDIASHGFVAAEDGDEERNEFIGNLGVLVRPPIDFAYRTGNATTPSSRSEHRPGVFLLKNPNNALVDNRAAGAVAGSGFFYDGQLAVGFARSPAPNAAAICRGNVAHSNSGAASEHPTAPTARGLGLLLREITRTGEHTTPLIVERFHGYKNTAGGAWVETELEALDDCVFTDNAAGVNASSGSFRNTLIVGRTANTLGASALTGRGNGFTWRATLQRDFNAVGTAFAELDNAFRAIDTMSFRSGSTASANRFLPGVSRRFRIETTATGLFLDGDGSIAGTGVPMVITTALTNSQTVQRPDWRAVTTPVSALAQPAFALVDTPELLDEQGHDDTPDSGGGPDLEFRVWHWTLGTGGRGVQVLVNGQLTQTVTSTQPLTLPNLAPGVHTVELRLVNSPTWNSGSQQRRRVIFRIDGPGACEGDWDGDGLVSQSDIFAYIDDFIAGRGRADLDLSGTVTSDDLFAFLDRFFAGCP